MTHPLDPASAQAPVRVGAGQNSPPRGPHIVTAPGETAARTTVLVGEGRGRRAATKALLIAVLLVAFDDYGPCGGPMTGHHTTK